MKVISQSAEIFHQLESDKASIDKHIERCARICYKSEHLIKEGSSTNFVKRMIDSKHYAMLEHATIYLKIVIGSPVIEDDEEKVGLKDFFMHNHFSRVKKVKYKTLESTEEDIEAKEYIQHYEGPCNVYYITTNYRVIIEHSLENIIQDYLCAYTPNHVRRITAHFVTDRGVWNENIRHRALERMDDCLVDYDIEKNFSFAQESSRYCNYSKNKFNHELTFIYPDWVNKSHIDDMLTQKSWWSKCWMNIKNLNQASYKAETVWFNDMVKTEKNYFNLLENGCRAEQARTVLNNSLKTEMVMTGFDDEDGWKHFFDLRFYGITGAPQAEMKTLAGMLYNEFQKCGYREK